VVRVLTMRYPGHFVHTRRGATINALAWTSLLLFVWARRVDLSQPMQAITTLIMTLMPLAVTYGCLRFLKKMEQTHDTPTPEMSFIFGLAVILPIALSSFVMTALHNFSYK
jgi:UDP-N-acetylmuramyl pentapeptide phosphotransferase/UDP-N-acetylglucosamine-1-phosphate transferase